MGAKADSKEKYANKGYEIDIFPQEKESSRISDTDRGDWRLKNQFLSGLRTVFQRHVHSLFNNNYTMYLISVDPDVSASATDFITIPRSCLPRKRFLHMYVQNIEKSDPRANPPWLEFLSVSQVYHYSMTDGQGYQHALATYL